MQRRQKKEGYTLQCHNNIQKTYFHFFFFEVLGLAINCGITINASKYLHYTRKLILCLPKLNKYLKHPDVLGLGKIWNYIQKAIHFLTLIASLIFTKITFTIRQKKLDTSNNIYKTFCLKKVLQLKYSFDETSQIFSLSGIANLNLPFHSQFCNTPKKMSSVKRRALIILVLTLSILNR